MNVGIPKLEVQPGSVPGSMVGVSVGELERGKSYVMVSWRST